MWLDFPSPKAQYIRFCSPYSSLIIRLIPLYIQYLKSFTLFLLKCRSPVAQRAADVMNGCCLNMHPILRPALEFRVYAFRRTFRSRWTNFRRLHFCGICGLRIELSTAVFPSIPFPVETLRSPLPSVFVRLPLPPPHTTHWLLAQCAKPNWDRWSRTTAYTDTRPSPISLLATQLLLVRCEELNLYLKPRKFASCL